MNWLSARIRELLQIDVTVPLAVAAIIWAAIGGLYGIGVAIMALGYALAVALVVGLPLMIWAFAEAEKEQLRLLEERFHGQLQRSWVPFFSEPSMRFDHHGSEALVTFKRYDDPGTIQMTLDWPDENDHLSIARAGVLSHLGKLAGFQDIQVGNPIFDDAYVVKAMDPDTALSLLTRDVQHCVHAIPEQRNLSIGIRNGQLTVITRYDSSSSEYGSLLDATLRLYDQFVSDATHSS